MAVHGDAGMIRAVLLALSLCSCATTPQVTAVIGPRRLNSGATDGAALTFQVLQQVGESRVVCGFTHSSVIDRGEPFHPERAEVTFDQIGCGGQWGGKDR